MFFCLRAFSIPQGQTDKESSSSSSPSSSPSFLAVSSHYSHQSLQAKRFEPSDTTHRSTELWNKKTIG